MKLEPVFARIVIGLLGAWLALAAIGALAVSGSGLRDMVGPLVAASLLCLAFPLAAEAVVVPVAITTALLATETVIELARFVASPWEGNPFDAVFIGAPCVVGCGVVWTRARQVSLASWPRRVLVVMPVLLVVLGLALAQLAEPTHSLYPTTAEAAVGVLGIFLHTGMRAALLLCGLTAFALWLKRPVTSLR